MTAETWMTIWEWIFLIANISFYLVVISVASRGVKDVVKILQSSELK
ncbi:MAG: hypothetical protein VX294_10605 [Candidatus Latescibacterota bacterium]|nr:hypothetical protein [Candidatus Latescibacterota bacterium]